MLSVSEGGRVAPEAGRAAASQLQRQWIRCRAGGEAYLIANTEVKGILRSDEVRLEPGLGSLAGFLDADGGPVPVYWLSALLGETESEPRVDAVVQLREASHPWALAVERVSRFSSEAAPIPSPDVARVAQPPLAALVATGDDLEYCLEPALLDPRFPKPWAPRGPGARAAAAVTPAHSLVRALTFTLAGNPFGDRDVLIALSFAQVLELTTTLPIARLPGKRGPVFGVTAWRGLAVPIFDLGYCLGGSRVDPRGRRLLVARTSRKAAAVAFAVDDVTGAPGSLRGARSANPHPPRLPCIREDIDVGGRRLVVPDLDALIDLPQT